MVNTTQNGDGGGGNGKEKGRKEAEEISAYKSYLPNATRTPLLHEPQRHVYLSL
jgi:hypothetical protein